MSASKLKSLLPSLFGSGKETKTTTTTTIIEGRLETDALPVGNENNSEDALATVSTPTVSTELTETLVRELSDPNYNSMEVVESTTIPGSGAMVNNNNQTMNVNRAEQQVVMNFSNSSNLHFGSVYNFNQSLKGCAAEEGATATPAPQLEGGASSSSLKKGVTGPRKTVSVVAMMQSQQEPEARLLDAVATHLGEGWKQVMRELGHSEGQIEQAIIDHQMHGNIKEVIYQLLLQWLRSADDGVATVGRLTTLLWEMNHRECVQRMKLVWKAIEKRKTSS